MADDGEWSLQDCLSEPGLPQILVINPNSNRHMTQGLEMSLPSIRYVNPPAFYTGPRACPFSINNEDDAVISDKVISEVFARQSSSPALTRWDGFLVACYSAHPLVNTLRKIFPNRHVMGILEASIITAMSIGTSSSKPPSPKSKFGIVTTGTYWEEALSKAVHDLITNHASSTIGGSQNASLSRFKGVASTGLNGDELHSTAPELVRTKMIEATRRLVKDGDVKIVILGCAGMSGLSQIVKEGLVEELGKEKAKEVYVMDGVNAGIGLLENLVRTCPVVKDG